MYTIIDSVTLDVTDVEAAQSFYAAAFDLGDRLRFRASDAATSGFRGYTLSLVVSQPGDVHALVNAAVAAGASAIKPVSKSLWGVGGTVQAPDGAIWKIATSAKKDTAPPSRSVDEIILLIGADRKSAKAKHSKRHPHDLKHIPRLPISAECLLAATSHGRNNNSIVSPRHFCVVGAW